VKGLYQFNDFEIRLDPRSIMGWHRKDVGRTRRVWDSELVKFFYGEISRMETPVFLDVGAADGSFSMLSKFHPMTVCAFEPIPENRTVLCANIALNELWDSVTIFPFALSDRAGAGSMYIPSRHDTRLPNRASLAYGVDANLNDEWEEVPNVEIRTLDSFGLVPDVIKIDVEGAEHLSLLGGEKTIREHMPPILMEYDKRNPTMFNVTRDESVELLRSWGYKNFTQVGGRSDLWCTGG
jgi:FkbM family methyltransferase